MAKPWACLCCGLLNSAVNPKCQACWTHCTVTESAFMCIKCKKLHSDQIFRWTKCNHTYCIDCSANLINESLSLQNQMPTCILTHCNQPLNLENGDLFKDLLLTKYKITQNIKGIDRAECLVAGYIRNIHKNIPHEVMLSIHDFYDLIYHEKINCYQCKTLGFELLNCKICEGLGYTTDCKQCDSTGIYKYNIECKKCNGTGDYIFKAPCNKCDASGEYTLGTCRACRGTGSGGASGYSPTSCRKCRGSGKYSVDCRKCNGSGTFRKRHDCRMCNGKRLLPKQITCSDCRGSGSLKIDCGNCYASGKVRWDCSKCHGYEKLLVLHFNKLCNKQSFCNGCKMYFPNDMVFHWSVCNHVYCYGCSGLWFDGNDKRHENVTSKRRVIVDSKGISNTILKRIPTCLFSGCNQELTVETLQLIPCEKYHLKIFTKALKKWYYQKIRFQCIFCKQLHLNENKILWSKCGHAYGIKCARINVDKYLIKEKGLLNSFKDQFIPKCCSALCGNELQMIDAEKIGITEYQHKTLEALIKKEKANLDKECLVM